MERRSVFTVLQTAPSGGSAGAAEPPSALPDNSDGQAAGTAGLTGTVARIQAFNGTTYQRLRTNGAAVLAGVTQPFGLLAAPPGNWSANHAPAANTRATISKAAGAAGVRHICTSITAAFNALTTAAEAFGQLNLRDGATGAGTILWAISLHAIPAGTTGIALSGLAIVGSAATAMTLEFVAAGGADTIESVALTGYSTV